MVRIEACTCMSLQARYEAQNHGGAHAPNTRHCRAVACGGRAWDTGGRWPVITSNLFRDIRNHMVAVIACVLTGRTL